MRRRSVLLTLLAIWAAAAMLSSACAPSGPTWVDAGHSFTPATISSVYAQANIAGLSGVLTADTAKRRHDALTELRKRGGEASSAADLITKTLPSSGVPVYVERASYQGHPGLVVVEGIGPEKGSITTKRLWVISSAGDVEYVGTR